MKKILIFTLILLTFFSLTGCQKRSDLNNSSPESTTSEESSKNIDTSEDISVFLDTPDTPDTPDTADIAITQRTEPPSPYKFPYSPYDIQDDLIDYAMEIGFTCDGTLTIKEATSVVKNETRLAANAQVLERWCKADIEDIKSLAENEAIPIGEIRLNVIVSNSTKFDGEYLIAIYAKY